LRRLVIAGVTTALVGSQLSASAMAAASARPAETHLPSASGQLVFTGHGWGHGIGMSQWGAYGAAQQGLDATAILNFYYPGTTAVRIDPNTPIRVLLGTDDAVDLTVAPVAANGALTFTDVARGTSTPLPPAVGGVAVKQWRLAYVNGATQLQVNVNGSFQGYPADAPLTTTGVARFSSASGVVRLVNPGGTQDDISGSADAVLFGGALRTVETAGLDAILPAVLGKEMSASWPPAALQAQAVAARSYADFQIAAHVGQPYDIAVPHDFAYEGIARYDAAGNRTASWNDASLVAAVTAYPGDVRTYGGKAIFAMFSSSNGGYTVARAGMPYLVAKADPYDAVAANQHHDWTATVPPSQVVAAYPSIGSLVSVSVNTRDGNGEWGGRVNSVTVTGTNGSVTDDGTSFYQKLGLQSNWWNLPGAADPAGALEVAQTAPGGAHIKGWAVDPKTTAPIGVHLYVDGKLTTAVVANVSRPDLAAQLPDGVAHGFDASLALAPGDHSVCAFAINSQAGGANPKLGCLTVKAYAGAPIGTASVTMGIGGVEVSGWTLDPESTAPVKLRLTVDGTVKLTTNADAPSDVTANSFPFYGAGHGFSVLLPESGTHKVCVIATNVGAGADITLACQQVTVYAGTPIGALDAVVPSPGTVALWGWAIDPDTAAPIPVHLYVDGKLVTGVGANEARPDVQSHFPVYGANHGYSKIVPLAQGQHTVCAWALNVTAAGGNPRLGCKTVTVPSGDPVGHLDGVAYAGQIITWGWAVDPKTPRAPILVHFYVDGALVDLGLADDARPDVGAAFPSYGAGHGFYVGIPAASGQHRVCAFAINARAGENNPTIGCGVVIVP